MDSSDSKAIQPIRSSDRVAIPSIFAGTVTGVKKENGVQTLEVLYSQGKVRFQAEGDFQSGEKVRLSFPGGNAIQVAKGGGSVNPSDDGPHSGYTLPQNLSNLRGFEASVVQWMANVADPSQGKTATANVSLISSSLAQMTLPELLLKVMEKSGGKEFLNQSLGGLDRYLLGSLSDAVDASEGDASSKSALLDILKSPGRVSEMSTDVLKSSSGPKTLDGFWSAEAGTGASPWFGRIMEKGDAESFMSPLNRLQNGGRGGPPKGDPMYRYLLDVGGTSMEVFSSQNLEKGELADFNIEAHGGRMQAKFMDPGSMLPNGLRTDFNGAAASLKQAMQLSSHYLQDFKSEPYYSKLVKDFSQVLSQSGRLDAMAQAGLPNQKELDGLLKLFVAFPRDGQQPEKQARAWGDAVRNPQAMIDLLKNMRPDQEGALLRSGTDLHLAANAMVDGDKTSPEALAGWLKKMLPQGFKTDDLLQLASENFNSIASAHSKDQDPAKFLLQSVINSFPKDQDMRQGQPSQFYFYQGQEWRGLQITWEKGSKESKSGRSGPKEPLKVSVETHAKHMGKVSVRVTLEAMGAKIDFKNQFHNVRELFFQSLPELEKSLDYIDFKVAAWTYDMLPEDTSASAVGWTRPASLSDGLNLDLFG